MDRVTVKIMSCSCKMADITEEGVSCKTKASLIKKVDYPFPNFYMKNARLTINVQKKLYTR